MVLLACERHLRPHFSYKNVIDLVLRHTRRKLKSVLTDPYRPKIPVGEGPQLFDKLPLECCKQ